MPLTAEGLVKLRGPDGVTAACVEGIQIRVVDGVVEVPIRMAKILASHGFVPYDEPSVPVLTDLVGGKPKKKASLL